MEIKNINFINVEQMIGSAIQQSTDGSNISMSIENAESIKGFLDSINTDIEILQIQNAYINGKTNAEKLARKYFDKLLIELKSFQNIQFGHEGNMVNPWGNMVEEEILKMVPTRDKMIDFLIMLYETAPDTKFVALLLKNLLQINFDEYTFFKQPDTLGYYSSDHKRNFIYEIFLYLITYLLKTEKYEETVYLLNSSYQIEINEKQGFHSEPKRFESRTFTGFNIPVASIDDKFRRMQKGLDEHFFTNRSLYNDLIKSKCYQSHLFNFDDVVSTDLLLFYFSVFRSYNTGKKEDYWYSKLHFSYNRTQNEVMLRATSRNVLQNVLPLFGLNNFQEFINSINHIDSIANKFINYMRWFPNPSHFLNYQNLNTQA